MFKYEPCLFPRDRSLGMSGYIYIHAHHTTACRNMAETLRKAWLFHERQSCFPPGPGPGLSLDFAKAPALRGGGRADSFSGDLRVFESWRQMFDDVRE